MKTMSINPAITDWNERDRIKEAEGVKVAICQRIFERKIIKRKEPIPERKPMESHLSLGDGCFMVRNHGGFNR